LTGLISLSSEEEILDFKKVNQHMLFFTKTRLGLARYTENQ